MVKASLWGSFLYIPWCPSFPLSLPVYFTSSYRSLQTKAGGHLPLHLGRHAKHRFLKRTAHILAAILILFMLAYPFIEPNVLNVHMTAIESTAFPSSLRPLRIVFVSDIHMQSWPFFTQSGLSGLVRKINAQNPDLVLFGGDYAESPEKTEAFFRALPVIRANYGVFAVLGEHDIPEDPDQMSLLRAAMVAKNVTPLVNDVVPVRIGMDTSILVAGLDDLTTGSPNLQALSAQCRNEQFVIFLCHNPEVIQDAQLALDMNGKRNWFDLGLFGHTHGGQIAPFRELLGISPTVPDEYIHGIISEGKTTYVISNGVGTSKLPIRLFCPPEINVITVAYPKL